MRTERTTPRKAITRRAGIIAVTAGMVAATAVALPTANAAPATATPDAAAAVAQSLGAETTAGTYFDAAAKATVVNVTDADAAQAVRDAGAVAKIVEHSTTELNAAGADIKALDIGGTAWSVDPRTNKLLVSADSSVSGAELEEIKAAAASNGSAVEIERVDGTFSKLLGGGDAIYAQAGWRCSAGFNVRSGSTYYFVTAGHCTDGAGNWYSNSSKSTLIGPTAGSSFPTNDYGLVRYSNTSISHPGTAGGVDITSAGNAYVGQSVTRHGSTTGTHSGTVTALNATVNYGGGDVVYGMIRTTVCAEPGDSGGSLRSGSTAIGLTSGGSGNCSTGGTTYFQPVTEALSAYGVSVY